MMTQTHLLMAAALYAKPTDRTQTWVAVAGGLLPDLALSLLFIGSRIQGVGTNTIFNELFWSEQWSLIMAPGNSFVLFGILLAAGVWIAGLKSKWKRAGQLLVVLSVSAYMHLITDFLLHADDARAQFWPLSNWIFHSPVSYWDGRYYGNWFQPLEILMALGFMAVLIRRYKSRVVRAALGLAVALYIAIPMYFYFSHHGV